MDLRRTNPVPPAVGFQAAAFFQLFLLQLLQPPSRGIASSCYPCNGPAAPESVCTASTIELCSGIATYPHSACHHHHHDDELLPRESMACPSASSQESNDQHGCNCMDLPCPCSTSCYYPQYSAACVPESSSMACPTSSFQGNDHLGCMEMCRDIACPSYQPCPTYPQSACDDDNGSAPESSASEGSVERGCMETCGGGFACPCCSQSMQMHACISVGLIEEPEPCPSCPQSSYNELAALEVATSLRSSEGNQQCRNVGFGESSYPSCSQNPARHGSTTTQTVTFETSVSLQVNGDRQGLVQVRMDRVNASFFSVFILHGAGKLHAQKHSSIDSGSSVTEKQPVHPERNGCKAAEGHVDHPDNSESRVSNSVPTEALEFATFPISSKGNEQHRHTDIRDSCSQSPCHIISTQILTFETSVSPQPNREQGLSQVYKDHANASFSVVSFDGAGKHSAQMHLSMDSNSSLIENQYVHWERDGQAHPCISGVHKEDKVESSCRMTESQMTISTSTVSVGGDRRRKSWEPQSDGEGKAQDTASSGEKRWKPRLEAEEAKPSQMQLPEDCEYASFSIVSMDGVGKHVQVHLSMDGGSSFMENQPIHQEHDGQAAEGHVNHQRNAERRANDGVLAENLQQDHQEQQQHLLQGTGFLPLQMEEELMRRDHWPCPTCSHSTYHNEYKRDHWEGSGSSFNGDGYNNREPSPAAPHPHISGVLEEDKGEASDQITGSQLTISTAEVSVSGDRWRQSRSDPQLEGEGETQDSVDSVAKRRKSRWEAEEPKPSQIQLLDIFKHLTGGVEVDSEVQTLNLQLLEIIRKLQSGQVLNCIPEGARSPAAEPIYDTMGIRIYTGEARARENLARERQEIIARLIKMNPAFCPPSDYSPAKLTKKLYIPAKEYPGYNFIGLVIGPSGDTQKQMERDTGAKIVISGIGFIKEGKILQKSDFKFDSGENEDLHVLVVANDEKSLEAAASMVQKLLTPVDEVINDYKSVKLRELAVLNGSIRDSEYCLFCGEHRNRQLFCPSLYNTSKSNVTCQICGDGGHPSIDCLMKGASRGSKLNDEHLNFLAVLGGGGNGPSFNAESGEVGSNTRQAPTLALSSNNPAWSSTAMDSGSSLTEDRPDHQECDGEAVEGHTDHQGGAESGVSDGVLTDNLQQYHQEQLLLQTTGLQMHLQTQEELAIRDHQPFPNYPHSTYDDHNELAPEFVASLSSSKGNEQHRHMKIRHSANPSCSQSPHWEWSTQMPAFDTSVSLQPNSDQGLAEIHENRGVAPFSVFSIDGAGEHTQMHLSMNNGSSLIENQPPVHEEHDSQVAEGHVDHQSNAESRDGDGVPAGNLQQFYQEQQQQLLLGTGMCMPLQTEEELMIKDNQPCPTYPHNTYNDCNKLALEVVTSPCSFKENEQRRHMEIKGSDYPSCSQSPCHGSSTQMPSFETSASFQPNRERGLAQVHEDCMNTSFFVLRVDRPGKHAQIHLSMDSGSSLIENQPVHQDCDGEAPEGHVDHQGNAESGADDSASAENLQKLQGGGLQGGAFNCQEFFTGEGKGEIHPRGWCSQDCPPHEGDYPQQGNQEGWCPDVNNSHLQHNDENVNLVSHGEESPPVKDASAVVESSQGVSGRISDKTLLKVLDGDGVRENKQLEDCQRDKVERIKATGVWNLELLEKTPDKSKRDHWEGSGSSFNGGRYNNKEPSPATPHPRIFGVHEEDKGDGSSQMTGNKMAISTAEVSVSGNRRRRSRSDPQSEGEGEIQDSADLVAKRRKFRWEAEEAKPSQIQLLDVFKHLTDRFEVDPKVQTLNLQLLEMTRKLRSGHVLNDIPEGDRSPSAEPIYDNMAIRINTGEARSREIDDSNVYVGYLPISIDEDGLMRLFLPFGTVQSVKLVKDRTTGISKRYGFVKFSEAAEASKAIAHMSCYRMEGKVLAVRVAGKFSQVGVNPPRTSFSCK